MLWLELKLCSFEIFDNIMLKLDSYNKVEMHAHYNSCFCNLVPGLR
jgi:hypothetical protein